MALGTALVADQWCQPEDDTVGVTLEELIVRLESHQVNTADQQLFSSKPFFANVWEWEQFTARHQTLGASLAEPKLKEGVLRGYLGIDSGSTTSKFVLIDESEQVVECFYAPNGGQPLEVVCTGLAELADKYRARCIPLEILGVGTTGYGELMMAQAFGADYHTVETVAHALSCIRFFPDADFVLDIGGQDMKAIWLQNGIITNIMLNEACSSGCGSFLENFADTLGISAEQIATAAFQSVHPAVLGSRCTVFMNSTIINEQRNGKKPEDLMAGLCRSIIENVFTKVIRVHNKESLGKNIIVQGGLFQNAAVLKALEDYLDLEVTRAPYPGEMGALGVALAAKQHIEEKGYAQGAGSAFIGFEAVRHLSFKAESDIQCPHCANHCSRRVITFNSGKIWVTGNRCERGAVVDRQESIGFYGNGEQEAADLFELREKWLVSDYPYQQVSPDKQQTIGLPCVLEFWDSLPFWNTFFHALGYRQ